LGGSRELNIGAGKNSQSPALRFQNFLIWRPNIRNSWQVRITKPQDGSVYGVFGDALWLSYQLFLILILIIKKIW